MRGKVDTLRILIINEGSEDIQVDSLLGHIHKPYSIAKHFYNIFCKITTFSRYGKRKTENSLFPNPSLDPAALPLVQRIPNPKLSACHYTL